MSKKVLIIISTAEKEKALTGILYGVNAMKNGWLDDVKIMFFGPSEKLLAEDPDFQEQAAKIKEYQTPVACKFISDNQGISENLASLGIEVEYVGKMVSDYIGEGYTPMVF
ncbi:MAG: hypothetical protein H0Z33_09435 [Bacillaceae bacterium]|nr:hypothetical protein [Bacillaceae bacterium]